MRDPRRQPADDTILIHPVDPANGGTDITDGYSLDGGTPGIVIDVDPSDGTGGGEVPIGDLPDGIDTPGADPLEPPGIVGPPIPDPDHEGSVSFRVKGTVRTVTLDKEGIPVSFLIDGGPGSPYDVAVVAITGASRILASDGRSLGPEAITEGAALLVVSNGPVRESYPVQFDGVEILIDIP